MPIFRRIAGRIVPIGESVLSHALQAAKLNTAAVRNALAKEIKGTRKLIRNPVPMRHGTGVVDIFKVQGREASMLHRSGSGYKKPYREHLVKIGSKPSSASAIVTSVENNYEKTKGTKGTFTSFRAILNRKGRLERVVVPTKKGMAVFDKKRVLRRGTF